jgi:hypothetical protein
MIYLVVWPSSTLDNLCSVRSTEYGVLVFKYTERSTILAVESAMICPDTLHLVRIEIINQRFKLG